MAASKKPTAPQIKFADKVFKKYGFDSIEEMVKMYVDPATTDKLAVDLLKELAQYQYQKQPRAQTEEHNHSKLDPDELVILRARLKMAAQQE